MQGFFGRLKYSRLRAYVFLRHSIDRCEEAGEVLLRVDVLFTMGREQDICELPRKLTLDEPCLTLFGEKP